MGFILISQPFSVSILSYTVGHLVCLPIALFSFATAFLFATRLKKTEMNFHTTQILTPLLFLPKPDIENLTE